MPYDKIYLPEKDTTARLLVYYRQNQMFALLFPADNIVAEQDLKVFLDKNLMLKGTFSKSVPGSALVPEFIMPN